MLKRLIAVWTALLIGFGSNLLTAPAVAATSVGTEDALRGAIASGRSVVLNADITILGEIVVPNTAEVTVDGNGHSILAGTPGTAPGGDDHYNMFRTHGGKITFTNITLDAGGKRRGVWIDSGSVATLNQATIKNGTTAGTRNFVGGAVYVEQAALNITNNSVIENNSTIWSQETYNIRVAEETRKNPAFGALSPVDQSAQISQHPNGGAIYATGTGALVTITDSAIRNNETKDHSTGGTGVRGNDGNGGAIFMDGSAKLVAHKVSFIDNHTAKVSTGGYQGGAIYAGDRSTATITDTTVNVGAPFNTGGFLRAFNAQVSVDNCDFTFTGRGDSYGISGGAFASQNSTLKINNSRFTSSDSAKVTFAGGFVDIVGTGHFELTNSKMTGRGHGNGKGLATYGGGIAFETGSSATGLIQNSIIENVHADSNGGAISVSTRIGESSTVNLRVVDSTITKAGTLTWGPDTQVGGAIFVGPGNTLSLEGATITTGRSGRGGLIYNQGSTTITKGTAASNLSGGFVYSAVGAGIFNDGYLKLDEMTLGGNQKGDWSIHPNHPSSITVEGTTIAEYPGLNVYANKDVIITPKAKLDAGDVRVIDGQSAVLVTGKLVNQLNVSVSENVKDAATNPYAGQNESAERYIGYTVARGTNGYMLVESDGNTVHYVTRDTRQAALPFSDHTGLGAWDFVLSDQNTVVLGQRAKLWYHPNEGHFDSKAKNVEEDQLYTIYSSTKLIQDHPAARPAQMTRYAGSDPVRDDVKRTITDHLGRATELDTYTFAGWYCDGFTPAQIGNGQADDKGYDFAHGFTDGVSTNSITDAKGHKNPCTTASKTFGGTTSASGNTSTQTGGLIKAIVDPHELTAYAGYVPAYGLTYKFVSGTTGKDLPAAVTTQTPEIDTNNGTGFMTGDVVAPSSSSFTPVPDGNGQWVFQNWDAATKNIADADQEFVGTWVWQQQMFKVTHEFKAADAVTEPLPAAIVDRTPADNLGDNSQGFSNGTQVSPTDTFDKTNYSDTPGKVWSFTSWDRSSATVNNADVHFTGYWTLTSIAQPSKEPTFTEWVDSDPTCDKDTVTQTRTVTTTTYVWNETTLTYDESESVVTETQERAKTSGEVQLCAPTPVPTPDPTPGGTTPSSPETPSPQPGSVSTRPVKLPKTGADGLADSKSGAMALWTFFGGTSLAVFATARYLGKAQSDRRRKMD